MAKIRVKNGVLTIPEGTNEIGDMAFLGRNKLVSVFIPDSVCEIGSCAFARCKNLTSISFPKSLSIVKASAFMSCKSLETVTIASENLYINNTAFDDCPSIKTIYVPKYTSSFYMKMLNPSLHKFIVEQDLDIKSANDNHFFIDMDFDDTDFDDVDVRNNIEQFLSSRGCSVLKDALCGTDVILAHHENVYLCSFVLGTENIDNIVKFETEKLSFIGNKFKDVIIDTLDEIDVEVTKVIVVRNAGLSDEMHEYAMSSDVRLCPYDKNAIEYNFQLMDENDCLDDDSYEAFKNYIETVITYLKTNIPENAGNRPRPNATVRNNTINGRWFSSPRALAEEVKKSVKGQDDVIDSISIPFFQHVESMRNKQTCSVKNSFIIAGNTGTGKSETLRRFAELCNVPIIRINISECTAYGWKGQSISDFISYYINDESDIEKLKYAVIVFNEFDKITHYNARITSTSGTDGDRDMQRDLLKFYDKGYELMIDKSSGFSCGEKYRIPTENMLLCFDGAFSGIEKIIEKRLDLNPKVGYGTASSQNDNINLMSQLTMEDLEIWGYLPELLGRIGSCYVMNPMTKELAYEIITGASDNILEAHRQQCLQYGIDVEFSDEVLWHISEETVKAKQGFRAAKTILSGMMEKIYFDCDKYSGQKFKIDMNYVSNTK